jgi:hypothetical protein
MLLNISYNDPKQKKRIDEAVGKTFSLKERWRLSGIGSEKLIITSASIDIHNLLMLDKNINSCNVELRPKGIIVRFRSLLETYGLIIPYFKLKLYKGKSHEYSIYLDQYFVKVLANSNGVHKFFRKISEQKVLNVPPNLGD